MPKETATEFTRRGFIKGAALGTGALALGGFSLQEAHAAPLPKKWDMEADIVIAGFGGAGACAAIEAAKAGASVLLLDKSQVPGGSTRLSGGIVYACDTKLQKEAGLQDSVEAMYKYIMACGQGRAVPELVRTVSEMSGGNVQWLESMGAEFPMSLLAMSGMEAEAEYAAVTPPMKRGHRVKGTGAALFNVLNEAVKAQKNVKVLLGTAATRPITRPTKGNANCEVLGIRALRGKKEISIRARKAVILTTGGIMSSLEAVPWLKDYSPDIAMTVPAGDLSAAGDGYRMGVYCGGALKGLNTAGSLPSVLFPGQKMAGIVYANIWGLPNIYVKQDGTRFVDEGAYYVLVCEVMIAKKASTSYCLIDSSTLKKAFDLVPKGIEITRTIALGLDPRDPDKQVQMGYLWKGDSISELAKNMGIDATTLGKTVAAYNESAAAGRDPEFNRKKALAPLNSPPYYGFKVNVGIVCHDGGLSINPRAQVLDAYGEAIPRLYAAGRDTVGMLGGRYPGSGAAISDFLTFGRIAGKTAAGEKNWK